MLSAVNLTVLVIQLNALKASSLQHHFFWLKVYCSCSLTTHISMIASCGWPSDSAQEATWEWMSCTFWNHDILWTVWSWNDAMQKIVEIPDWHTNLKRDVWRHVQQESFLPVITYILHHQFLLKVYPLHVCNAAGWLLFMVFAGVGLVALPVDCIKAFIGRPRSVISRSEFVKRAQGLGHRAKQIKVKGQYAAVLLLQVYC